VNDTVKSLLKKLLIFFIIFIFFEFLILFVIETLFLVAEQQLDINFNMIMEQMTEVLQNPISLVQSYTSNMNPLFFIGTFVNLIYSLVVASKRKSKDNQDSWETQNEGYHGSAHWGKFKQAIDNKNFRKESKKKIYNNFTNSLNINDSNQKE